MIKFKTIQDKEKKFSDTIELLNKTKPFSPKINITSTGNIGNGVFINTPTQNIFSQINTNGTNSGYFNGNGIINGNSTTTTTGIFNSNITTTATTINNGILNNNVNSGTAIGTISVNGANGIYNGGTITIPATSGVSRIIGNYHMAVYQTYTLFGSEIQLSPYFSNGEMLISLINTLGIEFWDEYTSQGDFILSYNDTYLIIEAALKPHRRDQKIDDILDENNDK